MEFVQYLDREGIELLRMVEQSGYSTEENKSLCLLGEEYVGVLKKKEKKIIICTNNAKKKEGYKLVRNSNSDSFDRTAKHIKKVLRHEAVHVAQECNGGKLLDINKKFKLNAAKAEALRRSKKISGEEARERQAYILEDKPKLVKKIFKKYCL